MNNLDKDLQIKFGDLAKPLRDERIANTNYWKFQERFGDQESLDANLDSIALVNPSHLSANLGRLRQLLKKIKLSEKDSKILQLFLKGYTQIGIACFLSIKHQYVNARIKSICDKIKKLW
jgi:DNA-binding CsgD family transcriptional regulator